MATDLSQHIENTLLIDTHEHLRKEREWVEDGPDILQDLFGNYVPADLITAGATGDDLQELTDAADPDFGARFERIRSDGYAFQIELNYRFVKQGARIKEIPFFFVDRTRGTSKMNLRIGVEALWVVWWLRIADALGRL